MKVVTETNPLQSLLETIFTEISALNTPDHPASVGKVLTAGQIRQHLSSYTFAFPVELVLPPE